jgi:hypothetical protein
MTMSLSVQPIIAASCMACTIPFNNSTSYGKIEPYQNNTINYKKEKKIYVVYATEAKSISSNRLYNINMNNKNNYMSKAVSKYRPMKISRKNRKIHNIHQPGRTNCSQRYQK